MSTPPRQEMPISLATSGDVLEVTGINGGKTSAHKLENLGIARGVTIRILQNDLGSPLLIAIGDTRVAIGHGLASRVHGTISG